MASGDAAFASNLLKKYASIAQVDFMTVLNSYISRYSQAGLENLGAIARLVAFDHSLDVQLQAVIDEYRSSSPENLEAPIRSDLYSAITALGGQVPSTFQNIVGAASDTATEVGHVAAVAAGGTVIVALIIGVVYLGITTGMFSHAKRA